MTGPFDLLRLDGKVLIVTGATQGLGLAIARRANALGAAGLVVSERDERRGAAVASELDARFVAADLAEPEAAYGQHVRPLPQEVAAT